MCSIRLFYHFSGIHFKNYGTKGNFFCEKFLGKTQLIITEIIYDMAERSCKKCPGQEEAKEKPSCRLIDRADLYYGNMVIPI